jgi:hypothetical protein
MKKRLIVLAACVIAALLVSSCDLAGGSDEAKRITFALVVDTRNYDGKKVYASVSTEGDDTTEGTEVATVQGVFESYPNTTANSWAKMTTLDEIDTNVRYLLDFFVDMNADGERSTGDLAGVQHFDVMPDAIWSETKYFRSDLEAVP